jgi:hypothetical protein
MPNTLTGSTLERDDVTPSPTPSPARLMTPADLAEFLQVDTERLSEMRSRGTGPAYVKIGRDVRYAWPAVREWITANTRRATRAAA